MSEVQDVGLLTVMLFFGGGLRLACTTAEEVVVETSEDIHLSLSRTFPLLYGEIEPFVSQIRRHVGDLPR